MKSIPLLFVLMISALMSTAQLIITPVITPIDSVQNILAGSGVLISNMQYTGNMNSIGVFTTDTLSTGLGMTSGIVMSTGLVSNIADNASEEVSTNNGVAFPDPQLQDLATDVVRDAAVLEFDFIPLSDTVQFRYVFGSEEYPEYVNSSYNDIFGFFITGSNPNGGMYTNDNIARLPINNLPVSINNVNAGYSSNSAMPTGCTNCLFYVHNFVPGNPNPYIVYDGMTTVLTAVAAVVPCQSYHIKIAIGDVGDYSFDSGVFLEANSFSSIGGNFSSGVVIGDTTICAGSVAPTLILENYSWPVVRWESAVSPYTTWTPIADTATTYNPGVLYQTTIFHAVVQGPCSETSSMFATILVDSMPIPQFSYNASGLNVEFVNESTNATTYFWSFGSDSNTSEEINPTYEYPLPGQYNVELKAYHGQCEANYFQTIILTDEKVEEFSDNSTCIYPNPTKGIVMIRLENENDAKLECNVIDVLGKIVNARANFNKDGWLELDLSHLNNGTYVVRISNGQEVRHFKVIVG